MKDQIQELATGSHAKTQNSGDRDRWIFVSRNSRPVWSTSYKPARAAQPDSVKTKDNKSKNKQKQQFTV